MQAQHKSLIPNLTQEDLGFFAKLIEARAGIHLKTSKLEMVRTRLYSRVQANGLKSFHEYRRLLAELPADDPEWEQFTNLLTTNKTDFFREIKHFEYLKNEILPQWLERGEDTFRVWSAASSTGEEPYTTAMLLLKFLPEGKKCEILASDIDTNVLKTAKNGVYPISRRHEIPFEYQSFIEIGKESAQGWFRVRPQIRGRVHFVQHNLISPVVPDLQFDLVLCRNVLIYFDTETVDAVQAKLFRATKIGGYMMIGHSESLQRFKTDWNTVGPSIFMKSKA